MARITAGNGSGDADAEAARATAAETALSGQIAATNTLLAASGVGRVVRNGDGTWPVRPSTFAKIFWEAPGVDKGAWAASTAYAADDIVTSSGNVYQAKTGFTSGGSFSGTNWNQIPMVSGDELVLTT